MERRSFKIRSQRCIFCYDHVTAPGSTVSVNNICNILEAGLNNLLPSKWKGAEVKVAACPACLAIFSTISVYMQLIEMSLSQLRSRIETANGNSKKVDDFLTAIMQSSSNERTGNALCKLVAELRKRILITMNGEDSSSSSSVVDVVATSGSQGDPHVLTSPPPPPPANKATRRRLIAAAAAAAAHPANTQEERKQSHEETRNNPTNNSGGGAVKPSTSRAEETASAVVGITRSDSGERQTQRRVSHSDIDKNIIRNTTSTREEELMVTSSSTAEIILPPSSSPPSPAPSVATVIVEESSSSTPQPIMTTEERNGGANNNPPMMMNVRQDDDRWTSISERSPFRCITCSKTFTFSRTAAVHLKKHPLPPTNSTVRREQARRNVSRISGPEVQLLPLIRRRRRRRRHRTYAVARTGGYYANWYNSYREF